MKLLTLFEKMLRSGKRSTPELEQLSKKRKAQRESTTSGENRRPLASHAWLEWDEPPAFVREAMQFRTNRFSGS